MEKYTQKQLKNLVKCGVAIDCTYDRERRIKGYYKQIGYCAGVYGCNGMLLQDENGQLYAITSRTTAIYIY